MVERFIAEIINMTYYKQCELSCGNTKQIAWIPEKFAIVDKLLILGKRTPDNTDRWTVSLVADIQLSESYLVEHERDFKTQRQASDI